MDALESRNAPQSGEYIVITVPGTIPVGMPKDAPELAEMDARALAEYEKEHGKIAPTQKVFFIHFVNASRREGDYTPVDIEPTEPDRITEPENPTGPPQDAPEPRTAPKPILDTANRPRDRYTLEAARQEDPDERGDGWTGF